jgi:hypothetical protein
VLSTNGAPYKRFKHRRLPATNEKDVRVEMLEAPRNPHGQLRTYLPITKVQRPRVTERMSELRQNSPNTGKPDQRGAGSHVHDVEAHTLG